MADGATHYLISRLPGIRVSKPVQAALVVGALLPDLVSKGLVVILNAHNFYSVTSHSLLGTALYSYVVSFLFHDRVRGKAWAGLWIGCLLHIAVDLLKAKTMGPGLYLFLPLLTRGYGFQVYEPLNWVWTAPVVLLVVAGLEWILNRRADNVWK